MSLKSDLYEAITWQALKLAGLPNITYEPDRGCHTCNTLCAHSITCDKYLKFPRLLHTIPDFYAGTTDPTFFHVCYWESKETSHAKFWRTVAELGELKKFVPNSKSVCIVFETSVHGRKYKANGWYPDFLISFRELFDACVFFDGSDLKEDVTHAIKVLSSEIISTQRIQKAITDGRLNVKSTARLAKSIKNPLLPISQFQSVRSKLWIAEQEACSQLNFKEFNNQFGTRLRNAILQIVLLSLLYGKSESPEVFISLILGARNKVDEPSLLEFLFKCKSLPIDFRSGKFGFLVKNIIEEFDGSSRVEFSEDLEWILSSLNMKAIPFSTEALFRTVSDTRSEFLLSEQVVEVIDVLNDWNKFPFNSEYSLNKSALWSRFLKVPRSSEYNHVAERLISSTGLGTYPLASEINRRCPALKVTRNDIRNLYSNHLSTKALERQKQILLQIAKIAKESGGKDANTLYLLRKTGRIVGPQSAINPLAILVAHVVKACTLQKDVQFCDNGEDLQTLANDLCEGSQAGLWKVSSYFRKGKEIVPIFFSAMKNEANCSDKTREFCGHMWMARWRFKGQTLSRSCIQRGIAVLEGAYADDDKRAFHLVGFNVCSVASLETTLKAMELVDVSKITNPKQLKFPASSLGDLPMAAEINPPPELKGEHG
jgi:hypothetical protein